jgi:hypothetical protein
MRISKFHKHQRIKRKKKMMSALPCYKKEREKRRAIKKKRKGLKSEKKYMRYI